MRVHFSAEEVRLDLVRDDGGKIEPTVANARNGSALIEVSRSELLALLIAFAQAAVEPHGAKIESGDLALSSVGDRALTASLRLRANKMLVSVEVTVDARADVDEHLTVRISDLKASGQGLFDSMVAGALNPKLKEYEGRTFDLAPEVLKNVKLSGLKVEAEDGVKITASFEA